MHDNDFNANAQQNQQSQQSQQTPPNPQGANNAASPYQTPQYTQANQNTSNTQNTAWQQHGNPQSNGYQSPQTGQPPYQYGYGNGPAPDYSAYGPIPPTGPQGYYYVPAPNQKWNTLCIVGFILSFLMPLIGLVISAVALIQINRNREKSKAMAIAGIAIGAVMTLLEIIVVIALVSVFHSALNNTDYDYHGCVGSDCNSNPFDDDGDDPDEDNQDTGYTYYHYDFEQVRHAETVPGLRLAEF